MTTPSLKRSGSSASKPTSAENIEEKLKAAEERRLVSFRDFKLCYLSTAICNVISYSELQAREAKIQAEWTVKVAKIGEASRKKDEFNSSFINSTKEQLETKMVEVEEKREALISDKKEKLKVGVPDGRIHTYNEFALNEGYSRCCFCRVNCRRLRRLARSWRSSGMRSERRSRRSSGWPHSTVTRTLRRSWNG